MDFSKDLSKKIAREAPSQQQVIGVHYLTGRHPVGGGSGGGAEGNSEEKKKKRKRVGKIFAVGALLLAIVTLVSFKDDIMESLTASFRPTEVSYRETEEYYQGESPGFFQRLFCKGMKTSKYCGN